MNGNSRDRCPRPDTLTSPLPPFSYGLSLKNFSPPSRYSTHNLHKINGKANVVEQPRPLWDMRPTYTTTRRGRQLHGICKRALEAYGIGGLAVGVVESKYKLPKAHAPGRPSPRLDPPRPHKPPPEEDTIDGRHQPRPKPRLT